MTKKLPAKLMEAFRGVDLILHAGDIYLLTVLDDLEHIAPVLAAMGDDDNGDILTDSRVKDLHILQFEGKTLWLIHEKPYAPMRSSWLPEWWLKRLNPEQKKYGKPDIVIFGHEHRTFMKHIDGVFFISSGSPTFMNYIQGPGTIGILDLGLGTADAYIVHL